MTKKKVLLVTHQLDFSGAPLALLDLAIVLKNNGFELTVLSLNADNGVGAKFNELGAQLVNSANIQNFDYAVFNTVLSTRLIPTSKTKAKKILWIHESPYLAGLAWNLNVKMDRARFVDNIIFPSQSCKAEWDNFISIKNDFVCATPIDIPENLEINYHLQNKLSYCIVDPREDYRGISRIEEAISKLKGNYTFNFIGTSAPKNKIESHSHEVIYHGRLERSKALEILSMSDIYVSNTCMATQNRGLCEAMALGKTCLISDIPAHLEIVKLYKYPYVQFHKALEEFELIPAPTIISPNKKINQNIVEESVINFKSLVKEVFDINRKLTI